MDHVWGRRFTFCLTPFQRLCSCWRSFDSVSGCVTQRLIAYPFEVSLELFPTCLSCLGSKHLALHRSSANCQMKWLAGKMALCLPHKAGGATNKHECMFTLFTSGLSSSSCGKKQWQSAGTPSYGLFWSLWDRFWLLCSLSESISMKAYVQAYESTCTCSNWGLCAAFPFPVWRRNQWHNVLDLQPAEKAF